MSTSVAILRCHSSSLVALLVVFHAVQGSGAAVAQDEPGMSEALRRLQGYRLTETSDGEKDVSLEMLPRSLLNWSNPVFGTTGGGLFLWVNGGRPAVLMKTYKTRNDRWFEQVRSFSTGRIVARESDDGEIFWSPAGGAQPMKPVPGAPVPAATEVSRLVQMKSLHRRFTVKGDIEGAGGQQELRLYPRPLYRYKTDEVTDGALLAFTQGTGPDVILMMEARTSGDQPKWHYGLGSIGIFQVEVFYDGAPVWSEPRRTAAGTKPTDLYDGRRLPL